MLGAFCSVVEGYFNHHQQLRRLKLNHQLLLLHDQMNINDFIVEDAAIECFEEVAMRSGTGRISRPLNRQRSGFRLARWFNLAFFKPWPGLTNGERRNARRSGG